MQVEPNRVVHMVRSVVLLGEYHMRLKAYENQLDHAILIPTPPPRESAHAQIHDLPAHPRPAPTRSQIAGDASCGELDKNYLLLDDPQSSAGAAAHKRSVDGRSAEVPEGWLSHLGQLYSPSPSAMSSASGDDASRASSSVDGMVSRSSTASRDSICPVVKETFGELVDKLRTLEGRQATFSAWPHVSNPRLSAASMAKAGFLFAPDAQASDKVLCAYCGLELAHWEEDDDPHTAHHDSSPVRFLPMTVRCLRLLPRVYYVFVNSILVQSRGGAVSGATLRVGRGAGCAGVLFLAKVKHISTTAQPRVVFGLRLALPFHVPHCRFVFLPCSHPDTIRCACIMRCNPALPSFTLDRKSRLHHSSKSEKGLTAVRRRVLVVGKQVGLVVFLPPTWKMACSCPHNSMPAAQDTLKAPFRVFVSSDELELVLVPGHFLAHGSRESSTVNCGGK